MKEKDYKFFIVWMLILGFVAMIANIACTLMGNISYTMHIIIGSFCIVGLVIGFTILGIYLFKKKKGKISE